MRGIGITVIVVFFLAVGLMVLHYRGSQNHIDQMLGLTGDTR